MMTANEMVASQTSSSREVGSVFPEDWHETADNDLINFTTNHAAVIQPLQHYLDDTSVISWIYSEKLLAQIASGISHNEENSVALDGVAWGCPFCDSCPL